MKLPNGIAQLITIDPQLGARNEVADYLDLKPLAEEQGIPVYQAGSYALKADEDREYIRSLALDIAFVIGWQRLVPAEVLHSIRIGVFGMHGSSMDLPLGRGRSPMNWALIEGRQVFHTNLFRYDPGVDSGDVAGTVKFGIGPRDTAETMHFKNLMAMKYLIERNATDLLNGTIRLTPQDPSTEPTYYPKRTPEDGLMDLQCDVHQLERFVRAVSKPFDGAFLFHGKERITIWDAQVFDLQDFGHEKHAPGAVVMGFTGGKFLLKCIGGLLLVNQYEAPFEVKEGMILDQGGRTIREFGRNPQGGHDLPE